MTEEEIAIRVLSGEYRKCPACFERKPRRYRADAWAYVCWDCYDTLTEAAFQKFRQQFRKPA